MSDLPKDAPGLEVDPIEPVEAETPPDTDNAQVQGEDVPDAA